MITLIPLLSALGLSWLDKYRNLSCSSAFCSEIVDHDWFNHLTLLMSAVACMFMSAMDRTDLFFLMLSSTLFGIMQGFYLNRKYRPSCIKVHGALDRSISVAACVLSLPIELTHFWIELLLIRRIKSMPLTVCTCSGWTTSKGGGITFWKIIFQTKNEIVRL